MKCCRGKAGCVKIGKKLRIPTNKLLTVVREHNVCDSTSYYAIVERNFSEVCSRSFTVGTTLETFVYLSIMMTISRLQKFGPGNWSKNVYGHVFE